MARFEASQAGFTGTFTVVFGTFTEQTATRMVLDLTGPMDRTLIFTGSFTYEDPDPVTPPGELPDGFDPSDLPDGFDPGDFNIPEEIQDLLDQFEGQVPDIGDVENYDVWGTLTGVELVQDGSSAWTATGMEVPLGDDEGEFGIIDLFGIFEFGFSGPDILSGSNFDDRLRGYEGNDTITGSQGDDILEGVGGQDTAIFSGSQDSYTLTLTPSSMTLEDRRPDGNGTDLISDIEFLDFGTETFDFIDPNVGLDVSQFTGTTDLSAEEFESFIELYIAYFNRAPDAMGLNFWGTAFSDGTSLEDIATLFAGQPETVEAYPEGTSNEDFVTTVYNNVLGRIPDQAGFDFWVDQLNRSDVTGVTRDQFILDALGGVEEGSADRAYLDDKVDIGAYFAVTNGMSDLDNASAAMAVFNGSEASKDDAVAAIDGYYQDALDPESGEFLMPVVGVLDPLLL
jgi:hypothetical protein